MNTKKLAVCLLVLIAMTSVTLIVPASAVGKGEWIKAYTVEDLDSGQKLIEVDFATDTKPNVLSPVLAGEKVKVTFTIDVFTSGEGDLNLRTNMRKAEGESQFWQLISTDYDMGGNYNPAGSSTYFNWKEGTFEMTCIGQVSAVTKPVNVTLVGLYGPTGTTLDKIDVMVLTAEGSDFENLYDQKEARLQSLIDSGVASGYTQMYENVLNESRALQNEGLSEEAISLLQAIPNSGEPLGSALEIILIPVIGVAAAAAAVFAVMFLRARGKNSYTRMVIEDQIKDLEGLTLRASKIDRTMASNLDSVKDRLKRLVGM